MLREFWIRRYDDERGNLACPKIIHIMRISNYNVRAKLKTKTFTAESWKLIPPKLLWSHYEMQVFATERGFPKQGEREGLLWSPKMGRKRTKEGNGCHIWLECFKGRGVWKLYANILPREQYINTVKCKVNVSFAQKHKADGFESLKKCSYKENILLAIFLCRTLRARWNRFALCLDLPGHGEEKKTLKKILQKFYTKIAKFSVILSMSFCVLLCMHNSMNEK